MLKFVYSRIYSSLSLKLWKHENQLWINLRVISNLPLIGKTFFNMFLTNLWKSILEYFQSGLTEERKSAEIDLTDLINHSGLGQINKLSPLILSHLSTPLDTINQRSVVLIKDACTQWNPSQDHHVIIIHYYEVIIIIIIIKCKPWPCQCGM